MVAPSSAFVPLAASLAVLLCVGILPPQQQSGGENPWFDATWRSDVAPLIRDTCFDCHGGDEEVLEAGLDLTRLEALPARQSLALIHHLRRRVGGREMPPADFMELTDAEVQRIVAWADRALITAAQTLDLQPGRVPTRKLSQSEYDRVVRDLFGVATGLSEAFPTDTASHGFDNVGGGAFSSLHLEKYHAAARDIARQVVDVTDPDNPGVLRLEVEQMSPSQGARYGGDRLHMYSRATASKLLRLPRSGRYRVRLESYADQAGPDPARARLSADGKDLGVRDVNATRQEPVQVEWEVDLPEVVRLGVSFVNDYYQPKHKDPKLRGDRNLAPDWLEVIGPLELVPPPATAQWWFDLDPEHGDRAPMRPSQVISRARPMISGLLHRAWRRPADRGEVTDLCRLVKAQVEAGASFHEGLRVALTAALTSPHFLYRVEAEPVGSSTRLLASHAMATRLAFALWSSGPDAALLECAENKGLQTREQVLGEARRMLADPRSAALARNFTAQWLELPNLAHVRPDPDRYPGFDTDFAALLQEETMRFAAEVRGRGMPVHSLLTARFTVANQRLCEHYGLSMPADADRDADGFAVVPLATDDGRPGGILRHGSILALTSNATRTSPVKRGKWVLENLLDAPPPPPPPGFDSLSDEAGAAASAATLREEMARHRADPNCAVCHQRMDAIGLTLESFDPLGRWRDEDGGEPIDCSGALPGGKQLAGAGDLADWLAEGDGLTRTMLRRFFVFAVGRDTTVDDLLALEQVMDRLPEQPTFDDIVLAVLGLDAFRMVGPASKQAKENG